METEQPAMDARHRTHENPISVQGPETPLTGKTPKFDEQRVHENEIFNDQQLCKQENNSNFEHGEPELLQIKEEQEEFWTRREVEQFIQKQEIDIVTVTSSYGENEHREPEPNSEQLCCLTSAVTENQDEDGSQHVGSASAESEALKMKKRRLRTGSHHEDVSHLRKEEKVLQIQQLCNQDGNSSLDQEEKDPAQVKEEEEELCVSQEQEHFGLKQETDTFMMTPINEYSDNGETGSNSDQLLSNSSTDTERQNEGADRNVYPGLTQHEEPNPKRRSHSKNVDNSPTSENQCNPDKGGKSVKYNVNEKNFKSKSHMRKHHTVHISEKPDASDKKYKTPSNLEQYFGERAGQKPFSCELCGKHFSQTYYLTRHMRIHTGDQRYFCETCGKYFTQHSNLTAHMRIHTGDKRYFCKTCGKHFTQRATLTQHMRIHTGDKPYSCEICGKHFNHSSHLNTHRRIHTGDKRYLCETCGKHFTQHTTLTQHMRIHTENKPFSCETCGKHFTQHSNLITHMRIHTGDKRYFCETCGKHFSQHINLIEHMRIHSGDKPYFCQTCGKHFTRRTSLTQHMRIHTGDKPYSCQSCGKHFNYSSNLKRHVKIHTSLDITSFKCF